MPQAPALSTHLADRLRAPPRDASLAILFPGQGSHRLGAGRDFFDAFPSAREVFQRSEEVLGFPLTKLCFEGPPLARAEGQIAFETLLRRFPNPRLETDNPQWGGSFILRGLKSLPISF